MNKKVLIGAVSAGLLLAAAFAVISVKSPRKEPNPPGTLPTLTKVVDVDDLAAHPDRFRGLVAVVGQVTKVEQSRAVFLLGCEDACVTIPVKYKGQMPKLGSQVTVYGQVQEAERGARIFEAQEIKAQWEEG